MIALNHVQWNLPNQFNLSIQGMRSPSYVCCKLFDLRTNMRCIKDKSSSFKHSHREVPLYLSWYYKIAVPCLQRFVND